MDMGDMIRRCDRPGNGYMAILKKEIDKNCLGPARQPLVSVEE